MVWRSGNRRRVFFVTHFKGFKSDSDISVFQCAPEYDYSRTC